MQADHDILPPSGTDDMLGAQRVCKEFLWHYEPVVDTLDKHLQEMIDHMQSPFADAYKPWHQGLKDLFDGIHSLARDMPLPDPERFREALNMFSFEGALQFLNDLCLCLKLGMPAEWLRQFRQDINTLLFSATILSIPKSPVIV
jgi:hypothetical protein